MFLNSLAAQTAGGTAGGWQMLLPLVVVFGVMYFLIIRPQNRKMKEQQTMQSSIKVGDTIATTGGLIGRVVKLDETEIHVDFTRSGQSIRVLRSAIAGVLTPTGKAKEMTQRNTQQPTQKNNAPTNEGPKNEDAKIAANKPMRTIRKAPTKGRARSTMNPMKKNTPQKADSE